MRYEELSPISREEAQRELHAGDWERISKALFRLALHDSDGAWLESLLVKYLSHENGWVRGSAATCLGHVARLHGTLDVARVVPAIQALLKDDNLQVRGRAEDALDDIETYAESRSSSEE